MSRYFLGSEISSYGEKNGYVDFAAFASSFPHIECNADKFMKYDFELVNGNEVHYVDSDGKTYTPYERNKRVEEIREEIEVIQDKINELEEEKSLMPKSGNSLRTEEQIEQEISLLEDDIGAHENEIETLNYEYSNDIFEFFITDANGYDILRRYTDEIVYYVPDFNVYLWGVTHFGASWESVLTSIPIDDTM
ncbi:MAG: hypothetical protein ACI4JJ_07540 [Huintestinicola sp.]